jgi:DNA repair protein SbcD/Mre11
MKILHTADWHLGAKLENRSREAEQEAALNWLLVIIEQEKVDVLIIAGDIFDVYNPPNYAERLYFNFIKNLCKTCCHTAVICAGNHDSAAKLEAAKSLLDIFNIKIIANIPQNLSEHIIVVKNPKTAQIEAVIAAVPFLTDGYLRQSCPAETSQERLAQLKNGIKAHYAELARLCEPYQLLNIPIISTGHLAVAEADKTNRERNNFIHLGMLDIIDTGCFSTIFNYVALGHLHYPHKVGVHNHIRYSGSLIALDFKESLHPQQVYLVETNGSTIANIQSFSNPNKRDLLLWKGNEQEISQKIANYKTTNSYFKTWLRLEIISEGGYNPILRDKLLAQLAHLDLELIGEPRMKKIAYFNNQEAENDVDFLDLQQIKPKDVLKKKLEDEHISEEDKCMLLDLFDELLDWQIERKRNGN